MKKTLLTRLAGAMFAAVAMCFSSCSSSSSSDVYALASSDDLAVAKVNASTLATNAGGTVTPTGIDFPADIMSTMSKDVRTLLAAQGIDFENIVVNVDATKNVGVTFIITDQKAFDDYITEVFPNTAAKEEKGYTFRAIGDETILFTHSGVGYMVQADNNGVDRLIETLDNAKKNPLKPWQKAALEEGNALGLVYNTGVMMDMLMKMRSFDASSNAVFSMQFDSAEFANSFIKLNCSLDGAKLAASTQIVNANGNALKSKLNTPDIDSSLLKYANANDQFVAMMSMPKDMDWQAFTKGMIEMVAMQTRNYNLNNPAIISSVASVLENIEGSVMLGFGVNGTAKLNDIDCVLAVQFKEGKAADYLQQIYAMASMYGAMVQASVTYSDNSLVVKAQGYEVYGKADGNAMVLSLSPISTDGGCAIDKNIFAGKTIAMGFDIAKGSSLAGVFMMPFGIQGSFSGIDSSTSANVEETGVTGGFIENILRATANK